ncbi:hypothetical protein [Altericista sp. CCNU0014]|uniref:hypothetical protein n=1 Tax=Altericista sp. CCNU0014 TaxID=3082949 RepID=UPI00384BB89C
MQRHGRGGEAAIARGGADRFQNNPLQSCKTVISKRDGEERVAVMRLEGDVWMTTERMGWVR